MLMQERIADRRDADMRSVSLAQGERAGSVLRPPVVVHASLRPVTGRNLRAAIDARLSSSVPSSWSGGSADDLDRRSVSIVSADFGPLALLSCLRRALSGHSILLVHVSEPPPKPISWLRRFVLRSADALLVDGDATSAAVTGFGRAIVRIAPKDISDCYLKVTLRGRSETVRRIVVVGDLNPGSGVSDLLAACAAWAEANAGHRVELHWIGRGDLGAMLAAQPVPDSLSQVFHDTLDDPEIAAVFERAAFLAVPCVADGPDTHVAEALAAGLPVLGSRRSGDVRRHVIDGVSGWLFDPFKPGDMLAALTCAFATSEDRLADMRRRARAAMSPPPSKTPVERVEKRTRRSAAGLHSTTHGAP